MGIEDYVLARLACLIRANDAACAALPNIWKSLSEAERDRLTSHFLADGIVEPAILFSFLPAYLTNSMTNLAHFGLQRALSLLVELLDIIENNGCVPTGSTGTIRVSLQSPATY